MINILKIYCFSYHSFTSKGCKTVQTIMVASRLLCSWIMQLADECHGGGVFAKTTARCKIQLIKYFKVGVMIYPFAVG